MAFAPLIPYIDVPKLTLVPADAFGEGLPPWPFSVYPFGFLVGIAVYLGAYLTFRYAKRRGLETRKVVWFFLAVVGVAFVSAHVLDVVFYQPGSLSEDPWSLLRLTDGLSSFGGFVGALVGALLWKRRYREHLLPYADVGAAVFPVADFFGRMGCAIAHDHPGLRSEAWFAVQYPGGGRFDLGLYEMVLLFPLAIRFLWLARKPRPSGFFLAELCLWYAPVRFGLDFLRESSTADPALEGAIDPLYGPFTPAQWGCIALLGAGVAVWMHSRRAVELPATPRVRA